jgi:hypothetical protein
VWNEILGAISTHAAVGALAAAASTALTQFIASRRLQEHQKTQSSLLQAERAAHEREIEILKGHIERSVGLHRAHFEVELRALQDIWQKISEVRAQFDLSPWDGAPLREMNARVWALVQAVDNQSPFFPAEIYGALDALRVMVRSEVAEAAAETGDRPHDYRQRRRERRAEFHLHVTEVSDLIRMRLSNVTVVSSP